MFHVSRVAFKSAFKLRLTYRISQGEMAREGKLLVLQREHKDLEAGLELVVVPLVRTVQRLF